ncbi:MAG TPA: hypothetical protein VF517_15975 [Thermoleophilaceae bacterium]|jgi:hypothetical protein
MKVRLLLTVCAVAGAIVALPAAPASAASKCSGKGAQGLASSGSSRVFSLPSKGERKIYACLYSQNKRRFLGWFQECQNMTAAREFRLVGPYVAYVEYSCGLIAGNDSVVVLNIKTGKVVHSAAAATGTEAPGGEATTTVTGLELAATASVVWIADFDADSGGLGNNAQDDRQVRKFETGEAGPVTVDSGLTIDPESLSLAKRYGTTNRFYWMKGGSPFTALLSE